MAMHTSAGPVERLVTAEWLHSNLRGVKVLDCSWYLPSMNRDTKSEYADKHIPGAQFFDIDAIKDLTRPELPHMLPPPEAFGRAMDQFGIAASDHVVMYDTAGVGPACRVFWTFHAMGHGRVSVLDGGLPAWVARGYNVESGEPQVALSTERYAAHPIDALVVDYTGVTKVIGQLKASSGAEGAQIVDARPAARFAGTAPEPRPGLSSGHMPRAISVPFTEMTEAASPEAPQVQTLKTPAAIRSVFERAGVDLGRPIIASCGSGVTASVLYFALLNAGVDQKNLAVYDGSWSEYALNPYSEIVKN
ncbi:hypothetical protein H4R18_001120 [Coemansia javaensis]|uniref:Rhodanese domain-containing protein n=1 Tax=Coemansia javaensis TaxID=2761396 RepID=A0A9W8HJ29_9FUNG|nr:hypothetical protein H4R18_001120 [Coemansia javaensis]